MPLHIDYRPKTLDEVIGNEGIKESIMSVFSRDDMPHTVLLTGPSGSGKTTLARIIATMIGCNDSDIQEFNSANTRGIDTIRELTQNAQYAPMNGKYKVYILDECHQITGAAANALLKVLEDTPKHVFFLLCTTDPEKLLKAIRTRCMNFEVKSLAGPQLSKLLKETLASEGIEDFPAAVLKEIIKAADGCPRQALILLDSVIDITDEASALRAISEAVATETASIDLCRLLLSDRKNKWNDIRVLIKSLSDEEEKVRHAVRGYMNAVLLSDTCKNPDMVVAIMECFAESYMYAGKGALSTSCWYACKL